MARAGLGGAACTFGTNTRQRVMVRGEDDDQGHDAELHVWLVPGQEGDGRPDDAHDPHAVDAHPDVLAA